MKKILRKIFLPLFVVAVLIGSIFAILRQAEKTYTYAEPNESVLKDTNSAEEAGSLVQDAIQALFANEEGAIEVSKIFETAFSGIGYVQSGITFLKLIGVMKDPTREALANIQRQLTAITDRLAIMDAKLDTIIKKMEEIRAEQDFIERTEAARDYREYYRKFKLNYVTNSLQKLITQFEAMQINSIREWYNAESIDDRKGDFDNSEFLLIYDYINVNDEGKYELRFNTNNELPTDEGTRYIKFSPAFLPLKDDVSAWNVNNFRTVLTDYIKDKINTIPDELVKSANFPELDDDLIDDIVDDLINLIIFRTTAVEVNKDVTYPLLVLDAFENYAENLNLSEVGFDACIKSLYYTHAFEYEISDNIKELCASFIIETAYYGSFVKDVLTMSRDIKIEKKDAFDETYCKAINKLDSTKEKALTGKPNYCYLTNTLLYYGQIDVTASGKVQYYKKGGTTGYMASSAKGFDIKISRIDENSNKTGTYGLNQLIGNHAATLISMTLRSNGIKADHTYFAKMLSGAENAKDTGVILADMTGTKDLPYDSTYPLKVKNVTGDYFKDNTEVSARFLPSHATTDYLTWHKMLEGSIYDQTTGTLYSNSTVAAMAIYGENHWFWNTDESAYLTATASNVVTRNYNIRTTTHKDAEKQIYVMDFDFATSYNCILQEALKPILNGIDETGPLYTYRMNNYYKDPAPAEPLPDAVDVEIVAKEDPQEQIDKAILTIPKIYIAIIVIPCVIVGLVIIGITTYILFKSLKKKKENKE